MTFEMFGREGPAPRPEDEEGRLREESPQPAGRRAPPRRGAATNRTVRGNVGEGYTPEMRRDATGAIARSEERVVTLGLMLGSCDVRGRGSIQMLRPLLVGCVLSASAAPSSAWFPYVTRSSDAPPTRKSCSPFGTRMGDRLTSA